MNNNIIILGASLLSGNRGVNALTRGAITGLVDQNKKVQIRILSFSTKQKVSHAIEIDGISIEVVEYPCDFKQATILSFLSYLRFPESFYSKIMAKISPEIHDLLNWADVILDISEGDSFSDIYGVKRFIMHSNLKNASIGLNKKLVLLPQTMGPFDRKIVKAAAKRIFNSARINYVRDRLSEKMLVQELRINKDLVKFYPDLAFYMRPTLTTDLRKEFHLEKNEKIVGLNVSGLLYHGGYTKNNMFGFKCEYSELINKIIDYFIQETEYKIVLVPHVITPDNIVEDDLSISMHLEEEYRKFNNRVFSLKDKNLREDYIKGIISQCDFFIGGRMHACIGAISTNVTTVPIAYSRKFIGIWEIFGLGEFVADPRKQNFEEIIDVISKAILNAEEIATKSTFTNKLFKEQLKSLFKEIIFLK